MTKLECQQLADHWDIGVIQSVDIPETGTINTIRILTTDQGRFALRIYRHDICQRIETEQRVVAWVAKRGIPAVEPLLSTDGQSFIAYQEQFVTLLPFAVGKQISRDQFQVDDVRVMGRFLGRLHQVLQSYSISGIQPVRIKIEPEETLAGIDRLEGIVRAIKNPQRTDEYALIRLRSRREWLQARGAEDVCGLSDFPFQVLHGDYQETNVFFDKGEVSAIIDWDKIYSAPAAWEVVRALHLMFYFEPIKSIAFLKAYQEENLLSIDSLDVAVHCYGLSRAYELWLFEELYDQGNDRIRQFLRPGAFVPLADDWAHLRPKVLELI